MSFVPGFDYDIYVSYAHVDNLAPPGRDKGWVAELIDNIRLLLAQRLGRLDAYTFCLDKDDRPLPKRLPTSATLLMIVSPGYLESERCRRELEVFRNTRSGHTHSHVFVIERDRVDWPSELQDVIGYGYRFWQKDPLTGYSRTRGTTAGVDKDYYNIVFELANDLASELRRLRNSAPAGASPPSPPATSVTASVPQAPSHIKPIAPVSPGPTPEVVRSKVFISYSHEDAKWLKRLHVHLKPLERQGLINCWDDTRIKASQRWKDEISKALEATKVAVLLISADFLASDFIVNDELPPLLAAAETEGTRIMPVIISPCRFTGTPSLSRFQAVNPKLQPLISMGRSKREELWVKVITDIYELLTEKS